jgi:MSHA type pilus biogenesis protein MshL
MLDQELNVRPKLRGDRPARRPSPRWVSRRPPRRGVCLGLFLTVAASLGGPEPDQPPQSAEVPANIIQLEAEILRRGAAKPATPLLNHATEGKTLYSFRAENLDLNKALAMFARANKLNIVPDLDVKGEITIDVQDLPLDRMMESFLDAYGFCWEEKDGLIRVHTLETRIFSIDYPRIQRSGFGTSAAVLAAGGNMGGGGYGGGGMGGLGGGGGFGGGGMGGGGLGGGMGGWGTAVAVMQHDSIDFWKDLETQLKQFMSPAGKLIVDKMAGLIQVTDQPRKLKDIERYLALMQANLQRQVDIDAKIYEVGLNEQFHLGVDWQRVIRQVGLTLQGNAIVDNPFGGGVARKPASLIASFPSGSAKFGQIAATVEALKEQGQLRAISQPRLRSLNNQTALIKVGTDRPFFSSSSGFLAGTLGGAGATFQNASFQLITEGTILAITPQIASNGWITLDVSPVITRLAGVETSGTSSNFVSAPVLDIKQSTSLIRVKDDETIVIGGLIQDKSTKTVRKVPVVGDLPLLGKLFQGNFQSKEKTELVIFLTPHLVENSGQTPTDTTAVRGSPP